VCFCFILEGRNEKFVNRVDHLTFSADQARKNGQQVLYVTERAVFRLAADGLELLEVAPGLALDDVLAQIPFHVTMRQPVARMPEDIFQPAVKPVEFRARASGYILDVSKGL